ncbi:hypothetical protein RSP03_09560 [Cereibacter sphaeroides]|nr:hypothetical protein RSP03_09560 [Cereibacter sphaeroides]
MRRHEELEHRKAHLLCRRRVQPDGPRPGESPGEIGRERTGFGKARPVREAERDGGSGHGRGLG